MPKVESVANYLQFGQLAKELSEQAKEDVDPASSMT